MSGNMAAILAVLFTSLVGLPLPFEPVHLLFINLHTDSLPAIAIGMEPADERLLKTHPRDPSESILTKDFMLKILYQGAMICFVTMTAYEIGLQINAELASTMAFITLTLSRLFHGFNCRSNQSIWKLGLSSNIYSLYAFGGGVALLSLVTFIPFLQGVFKVASLSGIDILSVVILAFFPTILIQIGKVIIERKSRVVKISTKQGEGCR